MKRKPVLMVGVVLIFAIAGVWGLLHLLGFLMSIRATDYAPGFDNQKYWDARLGTPIEDVVKSVGMPLRASLYYTDAKSANSPRAITDFTAETFMKESRIADSYVLFEYSVQGGRFASQYIRHDLFFKDGRLYKKDEETAGE